MSRKVYNLNFGRTVLENERVAAKAGPNSIPKVKKGLLLSFDAALWPSPLHQFQCIHHARWRGQD
jgi:hypothetical protein